MATMKEIAELSGVSRGTVDRVLNHRGIVNAETERKVLEIAKLLDYQPNKAGIALAAQKKKLKIGVLLFGAENPFCSDLRSAPPSLRLSAFPGFSVRLFSVRLCFYGQG